MKLLQHKDEFKVNKIYSIIEPNRAYDDIAWVVGKCRIRSMDFVSIDTGEKTVYFFYKDLDKGWRVYELDKDENPEYFL